MSQIRAAFIVNAFHVGLLLIAALATTISANVGGCKNRENDPNKELKGYTDAMGPFCRNKRAGAAFFWLTFAAWSGSLAWTLLEWYDIRKHPAAQGFVPPAAQQQQDDEVFASRLSQSFYEGDRRLFDAGGDSQAEPYHDPFADQQPLPSYPASYASHVDPYDAIRQVIHQSHLLLSLVLILSCNSQWIKVTVPITSRHCVALTPCDLQSAICELRPSRKVAKLGKYCRLCDWGLLTVLACSDGPGGRAVYGVGLKLL